MEYTLSVIGLRRCQLPQRGSQGGGGSPLKKAMAYRRPTRSPLVNSCCFPSFEHACEVHGASPLSHRVPRCQLSQRESQGRCAPGESQEGGSSSMGTCHSYLSSGGSSIEQFASAVREGMIVCHHLSPPCHHLCHHLKPNEIRHFSLVTACHR